MTVTEIIEMLSRRLANLSQQRSSAGSLGDLERVASLDAEIAETQSTLDALRTLG